jgi:very-short-patch-repair endonuclease
MLLWAIRSDSSSNIRFRSQEPLGPYIADFYCHPARLVIEIDGVQHNDQHNHDARRDAWMRDAGIEVFRVSASEVLTNLQGVYDTMVARASRRIDELRNS